MRTRLSIGEIIAFVVVMGLLGFMFLALVDSADAQPAFVHPGYPGALSQTTGWTDSSWNRNTKAICFWRKVGTKRRYLRYVPPTSRHFDWDVANLVRPAIDRIVRVSEVCPAKP